MFYLSLIYLSAFLILMVAIPFHLRHHTRPHAATVLFTQQACALIVLFFSQITTALPKTTIFLQCLGLLLFFGTFPFYTSMFLQMSRATLWGGLFHLGFWNFLPWALLPNVIKNSVGMDVVWVLALLHLVFVNISIIQHYRKAVSLAELTVLLNGLLPFVFLQQQLVAFAGIILAELVLFIAYYAIHHRYIKLSKIKGESSPIAR